MYRFPLSTLKVKNYTNAFNIGLASIVSAANVYPQNFENDIDDIKFRGTQGFNTSESYQSSQGYSTTAAESGTDPLNRNNPLLKKDSPSETEDLHRANPLLENEPAVRIDETSTTYYDETGASHLKVDRQELKREENIIFPDQDVIKEKSTDYNLTDNKAKTVERTTKIKD